MPRKPSEDKDKERGARFAEICDKLFPGMSRTKIADELGCSSEGRIRQFEQGEPIENRAIAKLISLGADVAYLLGGVVQKRESADQPGPRDNLSDSRLNLFISTTETFCGLVGVLHRMHSIFVQTPEGAAVWRDLIAEQRRPLDMMSAYVDRLLEYLREKNHPKVSEILKEIERSRHA